MILLHVIHLPQNRKTPELVTAAEPLQTSDMEHEPPELGNTSLHSDSQSATAKPKMKRGRKKGKGKGQKPKMDSPVVRRVLRPR